jgi:hypothetical protein
MPYKYAHERRGEWKQEVDFTTFPSVDVVRAYVVPKTQSGSIDYWRQAILWLDAAGVPNAHLAEPLEQGGHWLANGVEYCLAWGKDDYYMMPADDYREIYRNHPHIPFVPSGRAIKW